MNAVFWASYIILWVMVAVLTVGMFALYHHFGQMYMGSPPGREEQGPKLGSYFKPVESVDLRGTTIVAPLANRPLLAVFVSTGCALCAQLREALLGFARANEDMAIVVYCDGHPRAVQAWAGELADAVYVVPDRRGRIAVRNNIDATPFGVAVGMDGLVQAKGIVNDLEGLEHLALDSLSVHN